MRRAALPRGYSLQLVGTGESALDFTWAAPAPASFDAINAGQSFDGTGGMGGSGGRAGSGGTCGDPKTAIAVVQGPGAETPLEGQTVVLEGVFSLAPKLFQPTARTPPIMGSSSASLRLLALAPCAFFGACSSGGSEAQQERTGQQLYSEPLAEGNTFACATCHALSEPAADGLRRPGHAIAGSPRRSSFKNGQVGSFLDAANSCLTEWMTVEIPWTESTPEFRALRDYLMDGDAVGDVTYEISAPPAREALLVGGPERGHDVFHETCVVCHGAEGTGTERAPAIAGLGLDPEYVAERVRLSGRKDSTTYSGLTGGRMPFWSADRLTDTELADITAYLAMSDGTGGAGSGGSGTGGSAGATSTGGSSGVLSSDPPARLPAARSCDSSHPRVGQTATLIEHYHDVGGTVTIVDDCTLSFSNFTFDATGVNVQFYGGQDGNYVAGRSLSGDLKRSVPYDGANFELTLPEDVTLDDLDGISVWCVPVGVSFGDGSFE